MTKKEQQGALRLLEQLSKLTVRLATFNLTGELIGRASGFLYQPSGKNIPVVITAGHKLSAVTHSFIETGVKENDQTLSINAGKLNIFYNNEDIDYAFCELPVDLYKKDMEVYKDIEFTAYQHEFVKAVKDEAYGFSVTNDYGEFIRNPGTDGFFLPSYQCYEIAMELERQEEHINYFKLARPFQGNEYYSGASGSPIADPEGAINSILIGGCENTKLLRAFRLDNVSVII